MRSLSSRWAWLAAAIALTIAASSVAARVQNEPRAVVSGRVLDANTGAPIESAVVSVRSASGVQVDQVRSRDTGEFVLRDVPPGAWTLLVTRFGYEKYPLRDTPVQVRAGDRHVRADLRMSKYAVIGGQVVDESGDAVVGATVRLHALTPAGTWDPGQSTTTDDRGRYRIWTLRAGDRLVAVQPVCASAGPDAPATVSGMGGDAIATSSGTTRAFRTVFHGDGRVVSFAPGEVIDTVDLRMSRVPASSVTGRVDGAADAVGKVAVQLLYAEDPNGLELRDPIVAARTVTAADGRFAFPVVPAGRYTLKILQRPLPAGTAAPTVTLDTGAGAVNTSSLSAGPPGSRSLEKGPTFWAKTTVVADGSPARDLVVPLRTGAHITGRIAFDGSSTRPTPAELNRAFLTVWSDRREYHSALIETTGEFRTTGLPGGRYTLRLSNVPATGVTWHPKSITLGGRDLTDDFLEIGDANVGDVVITLTDRAPTIAGSVRDARGAAVPQSVVVCFPADRALRSPGSISTWRVKVATASNGAFKLPPLLPGDYLVVAADDGLSDRWIDPAVQEAIAPVATRVSIKEGDQAVVDLIRVTAFPSRATTATRRDRSGPSADDEEDQMARDAGDRVLRGGITGRVTTDAVNRQPIRQATVTLTAVTGASTLVQHTDTEGRFAFPDVPAGRYRVTASKAAHLTTEHGARQPGRPGVPVVVSPNGTAAVSMILPSGSVITGRVVDERGRPISDAAVRVLTLRSTGAGPAIATAGAAIPAEAMTDDRGEYRIYGLPAGEYYVGATPPSAAVVGRETTEAEAIWIRSQRPGSPASAAAPPAGPTIAQAPSFHPSAGLVSQAVPITLGIGEERAGVDVRLRGEAVFSLTGAIVDSRGQPSGGARLTLIPEGLLVPTARFGSSSTPGLAYSYGGIVNVSASAQGTFDIRSIASGRYTLLAREAKAGPTGGTEWATAAIVMDAGDRRDVTVTLQPTATVVARVEESGTMPGGPARLSLALTPASSDPAALTISGVKADAEGRFAFRGVVPGNYWLRVTGVPPDWAVHSATAAGRDVLDQPLTVPAGSAVTDVTVRLTNRPGGISGTFTDGSGRPAIDYLVVAFPADRTQWRPGSRFIQAVRPATDGRFTLRALPPGSYRLAAVWDAEPEEWFSPDFLAALLPAAIAVDVVEGETRTQDIQITRGPID